MYGIKTFPGTPTVGENLGWGKKVEGAILIGVFCEGASL